MILRFKKTGVVDRCIGCFELSEDAMVYIFPINSDGNDEQLHFHISLQNGQSMGLRAIPDKNYLIPVISRFKEIQWRIDHFDGTAVNGDFYLIYLIE